MIQLRRRDINEIKVTLVGPAIDGNSEYSTQKVESLADVKDLVNKYQTEALCKKGSAARGFVDDYCVQVYFSDPNNPNLTLIDLPGFNNTDDEASRVIQNLVQRYIEMDGTLCLHVCKGDQDYGNILGNDFMRHKANSVPRVTVLTHCDVSLSSGAENTTRLEDTVQKAITHGSMVCAIDGRSNAEDEKLKSLKVDNLDTGVDTLKKHLELRIIEHIDEQYPKAIEKLKKYYDETCAELFQCREQPPSDVINDLFSLLRDRFEEYKGDLENEFREQLHVMKNGIKNFKLTPVEVVDGNNFLRDIDEFDDLEPGQEINYNAAPTNEICSIATIDKILKDGKFLVKAGGKSVELDKSVLYSTDCSIDIILKDIAAMVKKRGFRNVMHADRQPVIAAYALKFPEHYKKIISETVIILYKKVIDFFDRICKKDRVPVLAERVVERLRLELAAGLKRCEDNAKATAVDALYEHNALKELVYDTNDHYLNVLVQKIMATDEALATDEGGYRIIYHDIRAYIKSQRKHVSQQSDKELVRTMFIGSRIEFNRSLSSITDYVDCVKEPASLKKRESNWKTARSCWKSPSLPSRLPKS